MDLLNLINITFLIFHKHLYNIIHYYLNFNDIMNNYTFNLNDVIYILYYKQVLLYLYNMMMLIFYIQHTNQIYHLEYFIHLIN